MVYMIDKCFSSACSVKVDSAPSIANVMTYATAAGFVASEGLENDVEHLCLVYI